MAKLNVVIPSVDVEVGGIMYRKVERSAVAGDIVKIRDEDVPSYVKDDAFYAINEIDGCGDPQITDEDGDDCDLADYSYEVYEKVTEAPTAEPVITPSVSPKNVKATVGQRIKIVAAYGTENKYRDGDEFIVDSLRYDGVVQVAEHDRPIAPSEYIIIAEPSAPTKYREVKRKANVGERIRIVAASMSFGNYENGEEFVVKSAIRNKPGSGDHVKVAEFTIAIMDGEYVVLEPIMELTEPTYPERFKVGEYAKVIQERHGNAGKIVKITKDGAHDEYIYRTELLNGESGDIHTPSQLIRATDAEVSAAKQALERTKAIGEFAEGGYAIVVNASKSHLLDVVNGEYVTVSVVEPEPYSLELTKASGECTEFCNADALRKITKEEYEAATKPAPKFEVGDYAKVTADNYEHRVGHIVKITKVEVSGGSFDYSVERVSIGGTGFIAAKNIEKVSAEEIAKLAEETQWAKIGRKVGEYKAGDVVEVTKYTGYVPIGSIGVLSSVTTGGDFRVNTPEHTCGNFHDAEDVKLIAPVESIFNVTTAGGERK